MICKNCGTQLPEGTGFCFNCGAKVELPPEEEMEQLFEQDQAQADFAGEQGAQADDSVESEFVTPDPIPDPTPDPIPDPIPDPVPTPAPAPVPGFNPAQGPANQGGYFVNPQAQVNIAPAKAKKGKGAKAAIIAVVAVFLVAALGVGAFFIIKNLPKKKSAAPFAYVSGEKLYVVKSVKENTEPVCVSKDYSGDCFFSEDGKYILYGENGKEKDEGYEADLYYKEIFDEKDEGTLIAKGVTSVYPLDENLSTIAYVKGDKVYYGKPLGDFEKIASDVYIRDYDIDSKIAVCCHYYSDDSDYDYDYDYDYDDYEDKSYYEVGVIDFNNSSPEYDKLISSCEYFSFVAEKSAIYYTEDGNLYEFKIGGDKKKISESGAEVDNFYATASGVYYETEGDEVTYYDLVSDPYVEADKKVVKPNYSDYEVDSEDYYVTKVDSFGEYETFDYDAYWEAQDKADEEYDAAYDKYLEAQDRNDAREALKEKSLSFCEKVYYYDGTNSSLLFENSNEFYSISTVGENDKGAYQAVVFAKPISEMKKIDINDVYYYSDVEDSFEEQAEYENYLVTDGVAVKIDTDDDISRMFYNSDTDEIYVFTYDSSEKTKEYDFYTLKAGKPFSEAVLVQEDCDGFVMINGTPNYFDSYDADDDTFTLHLDNSEKIDDVDMILTPEEDDGTIYFSTDYSSKTYESTVYMYKNGKKEKIGDDIVFGARTFGIVDGKFVYIADYDSSDREGTLMCKDGDKSFEIDSGVSYFYNGHMKYCPSYTGGNYYDY